MSFEETKKKVHVTAAHHLRPNSRLRKYAHNAIAILMVVVLSVWQTPAGAFAEPADDADAAQIAQVDESATTDAAGDEAANEAADADGDSDESQAADKDAGKDAKADKSDADAKDAKASDEKAKQEEKAETSGSSAAEKAKEPELEKWTIAFDANGGELVDGADASDLESIEDSGEVKLPQNLFERADYEFAGWNTVADPSDENIEKKDKLFVPDGVGLENLTYHFVVLTEDNADEDELKDAVETSDGKKIAVVPNDEAKKAAEAAGKDADAKDDKGRTIEACDLRDAVKDGKLKLFAQWREKPQDVKVITTDDDDAGKKDVDVDKDDKADKSNDKDADKDALSGADYSESDGVEAADVQGAAAKSRAAARKALKAAGVDDGQTYGVANEIFAAGEGDGEATDGDSKDTGSEATDGDGDGEGGGDGEGDDTPDEIPTHADGTEIESITAKWITSDTVDNDDAGLLYIRPSGDTAQSVRMQINYSLSGEHNYDPGDIVITIPASMFKNRAGKDVGTITIPFPKDPSTRADFNWKKVGDTYVLTNTKRMSAATKGYIQFAISGMSPHDMVDMQLSEEFSANIQVTTHKGNTIAMGSNALTAQFDTQARITDVVKRLYNSAQRVPASQVKIPDELKDQYADEDEFIVVNWYAWGNAVANTMYTVDYTDAIPADAVVYTDSKGNEVTEAEARCFMVNATTDDYMGADKDNAYTGYSNGRTGGYMYFTTAYPASQFEPDVKYTFHNNLKLTLTEVDPEVTENTNPNVQDVDPKLVTTVSTSAKTTWSYTNPKWEDPTGHFMVYKNGNDDHEQHGVAKNNTTHSGTRSGSDLHMWYAARQGWYGIYPSGLNDLQDIAKSQDDDGGIRLSYTIDTVGYLMPWMFNSESVNVDGELASRRSVNYNKPVTMVTTDTGVSIGRYGTKLTPGQDYDYVSVEFPEIPYVYYAKPNNINPDGTWTALTAGDGTFRYTRDTNKTHWPEIELQVQRNGEWAKWATASWQSGSKVITLADGTTQTDGVVDLPEGTENIRTVVTCQNTLQDENQNIALQAALDFDMRPVIKLKATDSLMEQVEAAFENSLLPSMVVYNGVNMQAFEGADQSGKHIVTINRDGYDVIRGYTTDTTVYPSKSSSQTIADVDYEEQVITIHYTAKVEERSVIPDKVTYEQAIEDGRLDVETHGFWRDLLPKGVTPDINSIRLRAKDKILDVYTIENYKNTGRTLLVVEAELNYVPQQYRNGDMYYYEDVPTISFDAHYGFDEFQGYGRNIHNVISFESGNDHIGTIDNYKGEPDDPTLPDGERGNQSTPQAFDRDAQKGAEEKKAMTDLNPDNDNPSYVYAGAYTVIDIISAGRVSLLKDVQVNADGIWSSGVYDNGYATAEEAKAEPEYQDGGNKRTVYEGGQYSYRLRMIPSTDSVVKDLIVYDSLETFKAGNPETDPIAAQNAHDPIDYNAPTWKGNFRSIDVSQLVQRGCAPVVYYSTVPGLNLAKDDDPLSANKEHMDLSNTAVWTKASDYQGSLDDVTAIAVDASKKDDGSDYELDGDKLDVATVVVHMQAPSGDDARRYIAEDAHAYNNAYLTATTVDKTTGAENPDSFVRKDYTKVGLKEYNYEIRKTWDDDNDRDGKRPATKVVDVTEYNDSGELVTKQVEVYDVAFHLLRNGEETGDVAYVSVEEGKAVFPHLPYTDPDGVKYRYSAREDVPEGYESTMTVDGNLATFVNKHVPERTSVDGQKVWEGDEADTTTRPASIAVQLYKQGPDDENPVFVKSLTVKPDASGNWNYSFSNLLKYEKGQEISYSVKEVVTDHKADSYTSEVDGYNIKNTYHPKGDLTVKKTVVGTTAASEDTEFPFTFAFTTTQTTTDEETQETTTETVPLPSGEDAYDYDVLDENGEVVSSGKLTRDNLTVRIKGGQSIHVKEIPEGVRYQVTEAKQDGFTQTSATALSGNIKPNENIQASVTNTYGAQGSVNLSAVKTLLNKDVKNNQFRYELYSVADDGSETLIGTAANSAKDSTTTRDDGTVESSTAPVNFGAINYTQADHGKTFKYKMKEINAEKPGYTYDDKECVVEVAVTDNGDGTLSVVPTYYAPQTHEVLFGLITWETLEKAEGATFENVYEASGETTLRAWKDLQGRHLNADEFTFELYDQDGKLLQEKKNAADGTVTFDTIPYTQEDIGNTYYYAIHEVAGSDDTVKYDDRWFGYAVEVIDNENGTLYAETTTVTPKVAEGGADGSVVSFEGWETEGAKTPIFENTLEPGKLSIQKTVEAPAEQADTEFAFKVKLIGEELASWEPAGVKTDASGATTDLAFGDEDGQIPYAISASGDSFVAEFELTLKGGEHVELADLPASTAYQVMEETPDGWILAEQSGVSGSIEPLQTSEAKFKNNYQPDITTVQFAGTKTLDGAAAEADAFEFNLLDEEGNVKETVKTQAGGFIQFKALEFKKEDVGEHVYTIEEVNPNVDTIDWDTHKEKITVTVALDQTSGNPVATVVYDDSDGTAGIAFKNQTRPGNLKIAKTTEKPTTDQNKDDLFTFKVTLNNAKGMPLGEGTEIYWYVEDADGNVVTKGSEDAPNAQAASKAQAQAASDAAAEASESGNEPQEQNEQASSPAAPATTMAPFGVKKSLSLATAEAGSGVFHATAEQLRGTAYAVLTDSGDFIFFRSNNGYSSGPGQTVVDVNGTSYTGRVFTGVETYSAYNTTYNSAALPWKNYVGSIKTVRIAEGQAIKPRSTMYWFFHGNNITSFELSRLDTSLVRDMWSMFCECAKVQSIDCSGFDTASVTRAGWMFSGCTNLGSLRIPGFFAGRLGECNGFFDYSTNIRSVELGANWVGRNILLPNPQNGEKWTRLEGGYGPYSSAELQSAFTAAMAGTWVWESMAHVGFVVFDANSGITTAQRLTLGEGTQSVTMPGDKTTKLHHNLVGWNTEPDGSGTSYGPNDTASFEIEQGKTITLYAQWEDTGERYYTVKHYQQNTNLNGYSLVDTDSNQPGMKGEEVTPDTKDYTGFIAPDKKTAVVADDDSTVVEYYYDRIKYEIAFDGNGATSGQMNTNLDMVWNVSKSLTPNNYQKRGSIFMGWNSEPDGSGTPYVDGQSVANLSSTDGDVITLYAQWFDNSSSALEPTAGVIYVQCKPGEKIVIPGLPDGTTYTVEEVNLPNGWSQSGAIDGDKGGIVANQTANATAKNVYSAEGMAQVVAHKKLEGGSLEANTYTFELLDSTGKVLDTAVNGDVDTDEQVADDSGATVDNPWKDTAPVSFAPIMYTQDDIGKTYTYTIREVVGSDGGVSYDTHTETVTVAIADGGHGTLSTTVTYDSDGALFTNKVKPAELDISKKILNAEGDDANDEFSFKITLKDKDGNPLEDVYDAKKYTTAYEPASTQTVTKYAHSSNISDDGTRTGNYTDYATERSNITIPGSQSLHVDLRYGTEYGCDYVYVFNRNYTGTISRGMSGATYSYYGSPTTSTPARNNAYYTSSFDVQGDSVTFGFATDSSVHDYYGYYAVVTGTAPKPESGTETSTVRDGDTVTLKGGEHITISGLPAGATYEVEEVKIPTNWTLVDSEGDSGTLEAGKTSKATFIDSHETPPDEPYSATGLVSLEASKTVSEGVIEEEDDYSFELLDSEGNVLQTKPVDKFGESTSTITFDDIVYTLEDLADVEQGAPKTFTYTVKEVKGTDESVQYDEHVYAIEVTVTDNGSGVLQTDWRYVKYEDDTPVADANGGKFQNEIQRMRITGTKMWEDDGSANNVRPSTITVQLLANGRVIESQEVNVDDKGNWKFEFDNLLKSDDITYTVEEVPVPGYSTKIQTSEEYAEEHPAESGDEPSGESGDGTADGTGDGTGDGAGDGTGDGTADEPTVDPAAEYGDYVITNTRVPNAKLEFTKYLLGTDAQASNPRFSFTLVECDAEGHPYAGGYTDTQANGKFEGNESTVTFDLEDLKPGEHWYLVSEDEVDSESILPDDMHYRVHLTVSEDGTVSEPEYFLADEDGIVDEEADPAPAFYNNSNEDVTFDDASMAYVEVLEGSVRVWPEVQKYLNGSTAGLAGGDFTFKLKSVNAPEGAEVDRMQVNDVTGKVAFYEESDMQALTFDKPGTYTYEITEDIPSGATDNGDGTFTKDDTTYDGSTITMTVTVTEADGVLSADVQYAGMSEGTAPAFYNTREVEPEDEPVELWLSVDKFQAGTHAYLPGAHLELRDDDGWIVEDWTTDGSVHRLSKALEPGESYTLIETSAPNGYETVADTKFTVAEDGSGIKVTAKDGTTQLVDESRIALYDPAKPGERVVTKVKTTPGKNGTPQTGDTLPFWLVPTLAAAAILALLLALWAKRRRDPAVRGAHVKR